MRSLAEQLVELQLGGLCPTDWLVVGEGVSREQVRECWLAEHGVIGSASVLNRDELCLRILTGGGVESAHAKRVLGRSARQELLRELLAERGLRGAFPELQRLRRKHGFLRRLERALLQGRLSYAHLEEQEAQEAHLLQRDQRSRLRPELIRLAVEYERRLSEREIWDAPLLIDGAIQILRAVGVARRRDLAAERLAGLVLPTHLKRVVWLSAVQSSPREEALLSELSTWCEVVRLWPSPIGESTSARATLERWHTIDDACEGLADALRLAPESARWAVLIPDQPEIRRSLRRVLDRDGVPLEDPRDPTEVKRDEGLRRALLPLELLASRFERLLVLEWCRGVSDIELRAQWTEEIQARGVQSGLAAYAGGRLEGLGERLRELANRLAPHGDRLRASELRGRLAQEAERAGLSARTRSELDRLLGAIEKDLATLGTQDRAVPARVWRERIRLRLEDATPLPARTRPRRGLALYRLEQLPLQTYDRVWVLGMPPGWIQSEERGDLWFTARERETLGSEFGIRTAREQRSERTRVLKHWLASCQEAVWLDAAYDWDGQEREGIEADLRGAWGESPPLLVRGGHPRLAPARRPSRLQTRLRAELSPWPERDSTRGGAVRISASAIDAQSDCGLVGLGKERWRLFDLMEPGWTPWPKSVGVLLHDAARRLLERSESGTGFGTEAAIAQAIDEAWRERPPQGFFRSPRTLAAEKRRLTRVLATFAEQEQVYAERTSRRVLSRDELALALELTTESGERLVVTGRPDRVDEVSQGGRPGLIVIDYKTGSLQKASGREMLERGCRMQLPAYALALGSAAGQAAPAWSQTPVIGVQFVELTSRGGRSSGIFPRAWTYLSKADGRPEERVFKSTSRSQSVIDLEPEAIWTRLRARVTQVAQSFARGEHAAQPAQPDHCADCRYSDLCGWRRRPEWDEEVTSGGGS